MKGSKSKRDAMIVILLGTNGTGKTTYIKKATQGQRRLILTSTGRGGWAGVKHIAVDQLHTNWKGTRQIAMFENDQVFTKIIDNKQPLRNCTVIMDDCRNYIKSNIDHTPGLKVLLIDYRHLKLDLWFVIHSPNQVPPQVYDFANWALVGHAPVLINTSRVELQQAQTIKETQIKITEEFFQRKDKGKSTYGLFKPLRLK